MAPQTVNVLLTTFSGLGLPSTLSLPVPSSSTIGDVERIVSERLPSSVTNLTLTTTSNKLLSSRRNEPITALLGSQEDTFLPLRLSAQLCGGKGGFGSQLRAAGGRMNKKKKTGETNGSNRNLDGRRLRTVTEAKNLAEYLALKPEMDKRSKEEARKRQEAVVRMAEDRMEEIKTGGKARVDGKWLEDKEEAADKVRAAVLAAASAGEIKDLLRENESDSTGNGSEESADSDEEMAEAAAEKKPTKDAPSRVFFGWDEEDFSDDSEDKEVEKEAEKKDAAVEEESVEDPVAALAPRRTDRGKGKGKAKA